MPRRPTPPPSPPAPGGGPSASNLAFSKQPCWIFVCKHHVGWGGGGGVAPCSAKPSCQFPPETAPVGAAMPVCCRVTASSASRPLRQGTQTPAKAGSQRTAQSAPPSVERRRWPPCPPVPFLLESCAWRPFDPTVLAPGRMSELQPHSPLPPDIPCIFWCFENCGGSGQRKAASGCLETGQASGNSDVGASSCRCPFRGLCRTTGSGQSRGVTPHTDGRRNRLSSRKDLAAGMFIGRKEISSFHPF